MPEKPVTVLSVMYDVALITINQLSGDFKVISEIFNSIASENINVDMISHVPPYVGNVSISFTLPSNDLLKAIAAINRFKQCIPELQILVDACNTKLSVFGENMKYIPGVAAKLFTILADNDIEVKMVTTSEVDISCLLYEKDADRAIQSVKNGFELE